GHPLPAARAAAAYGIKVHPSGTARKGPALLPIEDPRFGRRVVQIPDELDEDSLIAVAAETGGRYYRAESAKELEAIYAEIDRLEKTELRLPPIVSYTDLHGRLLLLAALLLAAGMLSSRTLLLRLP
ncbi:MAG: aerotolerance regulator BatA, partial [Elusimicrobiota bacterium]